MTPQAILLATNNAKKARELQELSEGSARVLTLKDVGLDGIDVVEDAPDFRGNCHKKATEIRAALAGKGGGDDIDVIIADDSGLCVDAVDGRPGVRSARFAVDAGYCPPGVSADDKDARNNRLLLALLGGLPVAHRRAHFHCHVCAVPGPKRADAPPLDATGALNGIIATESRGDHGFGYDPIFVVKDDGAAPGVDGRHLAELDASTKHAISHRGRAMRALLAQLAAR